MNLSAAIEANISQLILREALRNELKLAYVRGLILFVSAIADTIVFFFPQATLNLPAVSIRIALTTWFLSFSSLIVLYVLRKGGYRRWLQLLLPIYDGLIAGLVISGLAEVLGQSKPQIIANITAFCTVLAVSGGIRLTQTAAMTTTTLALLDFIYAAWRFHLSLGTSVFTAISISTAGFLGGWMATIVQRQVNNEVGRLWMERLLPRAVVQSAFEDPLGLLAHPQICEVTIVVTDLRGFTSFAENLSPVSVLEFLSQFQGLLAKIVRDHDGIVDKFMGDGMLAVFGAPEPMEHHAEQAIRAAIAMLHQIPSLGSLKVGIGIHSGTVVAGCLGNGDRMEFTVIGDTVNVASRLESLSKELQQALVISGETTRRSGLNSFKSLGSVTIRGRNEPLEIFTVCEEGKVKEQGQSPPSPNGRRSL